MIVRDSLKPPLEALVVVDYLGRIVEFNRAAEELSGYSKHELSRLSIYAFFDKDDYLNYLGEFTRIFLDGSASEKLVFLHAKGGRPLFVRASAKLSRFQGKPAITATLREEVVHVK